MKQWIVIAVLAVLSGSVHAQKIRAYWKKDTVLIGQPATLIVELENIKQDIKLPQLTTPLGCGRRQSNEVLYKQDAELDISSTNKKENKKAHSLTVTYQFIAWDSAIYQLPELEFTLINQNSGKRDTSLFVKAPELNVVFRKQKYNHEIMEVSVEPEFSIWTWLKNYWWIVLIGIAIPTIVFFWNRRRKHQFTSKETLKTRTLKRLHELRKKAYWQSGKVEQHYMEFTFLLRNFLSERYQHSFLEKTSFECRIALKTLGADDLLISRVSELLYEADLAKFGKTIPSEETTLLSLNKLEEIIIELSPLDIPTS